MPHAWTMKSFLHYEKYAMGYLQRLKCIFANKLYLLFCYLCIIIFTEIIVRVQENHF